MVEVERIAEVLGGADLLGREVRSLGELQAAVEEGLPKASLGRTLRHVTTDPGEARRLAARVVPPATLKRRTSVLKPDESEKLERLARVIATAETVWGNGEQARLFLVTAHPLLERRAPIELATTELGARRVEDLLWQLAHGLPV